MHIQIAETSAEYDIPSVPLEVVFGIALASIWSAPSGSGESGFVAHFRDDWLLDWASSFALGCSNNQTSVSLLWRSANTR